MKRVRISFEKSFHHVMNRGILTEKILLDENDKTFFIKLMFKLAIKYKITIFAYCVMDNHYHIILRNDGNKLSFYMKELDGGYAIYYRKKYGGKGYVFQNRFKSTLIEGDRYFKMSLVYVMLNPYRAGYVQDPKKYKWSSIREYFNQKPSNATDAEYVEGLFKNNCDFYEMLDLWKEKNLKIKKTKYGEMLGNPSFMKTALRKFDRRKRNKNSYKLRKSDENFEKPKDVIASFQKVHKLSIADIDLRTNIGKNLRAELLVNMRDRCGMTYKQLSKFNIFSEIKCASMGHIYNRYKNKKVKKSSI